MGCRRRRSWKAHPRMRGEHPLWWNRMTWSDGSSPHARGALWSRFQTDMEKRLIPACAGSTQSGGFAQQDDGAHPRMRGEHPDRHAGLDFAGGSSPHARGAPLRVPCPHIARGLIPACAGSTYSSIERIVDAWGSSPHARGAHQVPGHGLVRDGLIPACAGSTRRPQRRSRVRWAHPRMRGEHNSQPSACLTGWGSSPHARGARCGYRPAPPRWRLIPACAGSTSMISSGSTVPSAHPRMRGEHSPVFVDPVTDQGSSPHARGARPTP